MGRRQKQLNPPPRCASAIIFLVSLNDFYLAAAAVLPILVFAYTVGHINR